MIYQVPASRATPHFLSAPTHFLSAPTHFLSARLLKDYSPGTGQSCYSSLPVCAYSLPVCAYSLPVCQTTQGLLTRYRPVVLLLTSCLRLLTSCLRLLTSCLPDYSRTTHQVPASRATPHFLSAPTHFLSARLLKDYSPGTGQLCYSSLPVCAYSLLVCAYSLPVCQTTQGLLTRFLTIWNLRMKHQDVDYEGLTNFSHDLTSGVFVHIRNLLKYVPVLANVSGSYLILQGV